MKKLPLLFFCVFFMFAGCGSTAAKPVDKFSGEICSVYNGVKIKAEINSISNNSLNLKITSPKSLRGYNYSFKNDKLLLTYKNLKLESSKSYLNKRDFSVIIYNIISSIKKEDNLVLQGSYNSFSEYKGECESGDYTLKSDMRTGLIKEVSIKELKFKIILKNLKEIK